MTRAPQLVVGTAGHIDHGKSRLVRTLTGSDPDRLPEERARGMTIDLGFAHTRLDGCDVWFVDVPGHERFIRNMVAGATGIDAALLVVAADDSVMPQTREHAELLSLLGVGRCVVALTKMDLVDDEWAEQVEEEVRELLGGLGLHAARFVRTSAESGRGLEELRNALGELARGGDEPRESPRWFRLPIDRAFVVAGRGTVVTGSLAHGSVQRDDELELWPAGRRVRVRDIETHHDHVDAAGGRMRLALNLAGVSRGDVWRGCELATPGYLEPADCTDVWLPWLRMPGKARRQVLRLRLHIATGELLARLRLLEAPADGIVRDQFAQLRLERPIVAAWNQRFILRDEAGTRTLGGGCVLRPVATPWSSRYPPDPEGLRVLRDGEPVQRVEQAVRAWRWDDCGPARLAARTGLADADAATQALDRLRGGQRVQRLETGTVTTHVHAALLDDVADTVTERLAAHLRANARLPGVARGEWPGWMPRACPERLRPALAEWLIERGRVRLADKFVVPRDHVSAMSAEDTRLLDEVLDAFHAAGFRPPAMADLAAHASRKDKRVQQLVDLAVARGRLVRVAPGMWIHADRWDEIIRRVTGAIRERGALTVSDIRTVLDSTRKYVVPIVEHLDALGVTTRAGDTRSLGPKA